jgi:hypothetical protein
MQFETFSKAIHAKFKEMSEGTLFVTNTDRTEIWDTYLKSFPEGTDPLVKERTEHDCNCCKQFIRNVGRVVSVKDGKMTSIWDVEVDSFYQEVANAMSEYVKSKSISDNYLHYESSVGKFKTHSQDENGKILTWDHYQVAIPRNVLKRKDDIATELSNLRSNGEVLLRSLNELTIDSAETVVELIDQNSLYRGAEHRSTLELFLTLKREFDALDDADKEMFCWDKSTQLKGASKIRNTVIASLLTDLSEGKDLEHAVKSFEAKVAPSNYKRPKALITKGMIDKAYATVTELGYESALPRRFAQTEDLTINNVIFADRSVKAEMNVFEELIAETGVNTKSLDKVEEISIEDFITKVVPKANSVEMLVSNNHTSNFVSLIAPKDADSKNMFKWDNNFSWSYNGEVADSMKEQVKKAGGSVTGDLRFSLAWYSRNDLDLHVVEPNGNMIYFSNPRSPKTKGKLDVDNTSGGTLKKPAVENITWDNKSTLLEGRYKVFVRNFSGTNSNESGFDFEMEFGGTIHQMSYKNEVSRKQDVTCVEIDYTHADGVKIVSSLDFDTKSKEVWGINTETFIKVNMIMNSPNHWDGNETGNKHWFFMIDECNSGESGRGFYNEFLDEALTPHRKVFEVLGSKMKAEPTDTQVSGLGFSSTQRNHAFFKVEGKFNRTVKVLF